MIGRVARVMRAVGDFQPDGATTATVARRAELARPTVHRLLIALAAEGYVDRTGNGLWLLGPETYLLGSLATDRYDITSVARETLRELARVTGESAFLSARRGDETVVLAGEEGSFPLRSHVLYTGRRLPLGVASAGLAIVSYLSDRERADYFERADLTRWGEAHSRASIDRRIRDTLRDGYATNPGLLVEGSWGMAAAVFDRHRAPAWALTLTGVVTRFDDTRRPVLGEQLLTAAHSLGMNLDPNRRK